MGKLYGNASNFRTQKVLAAAKLAGKSVDLAGENAPAAQFPLGSTPAYVDGETSLFGSDSIALYLAGQNLKGNCHEVTQWIQWAEGSLLPNVLGYVLPSVSAAQLDNKTVELYKAELLAQLSHLNEVLLSKTFLVGERLSLADLSVAFDLLPAFQHVLDANARKQLVNVTRFFLTIMNQPSVKEVVGELHLADAVAQFNDADFKKFAAKLTKAAPKKEEKKKAEKKEKPAAAAPELDAAEEALAAEPKAKDPFESMPKGTFVLDAFKRCYSNEDTATKAIPHFWENFDAENWSIWKCEYKYPEDLSLAFMSCNLIGGMFQRLEKLKKNAFASMILFGTDNNSTISGVWVWKGHELAFPLSPDWQIDYESYDWQKLDPKDEKTKKIVNEYWMWEGDFDGKKFNQGKIFK